MSSTPDRNLILIAEIGAAHGIRGAARLRLFGQGLHSFQALNEFCDDRGRIYSLRHIRAGRKDSEAIAEFHGLEDRQAIEAIKGTKLYVPRSLLPQVEQEDEFYHIDLIGLEAKDEEDENLLGTIRAVHNFGAGDILELTTLDGATVMHPFDRHFTPHIDLAGGYVILRGLNWNES